MGYGQDVTGFYTINPTNSGGRTYKFKAFCSEGKLSPHLGSEFSKAPQYLNDIFYHFRKNAYFTRPTTTSSSTKWRFYQYRFWIAR